jgi:tRNA/rRNA methyltransferase
MSAQWIDPGYEFVLVQPSHAGNIGAAARALKVMGFNRLTVVNPRQIDFACHPEAVAFASGAQALLDSAQPAATLGQALANTTLAIAVSAAGREFSARPMAPEAAAILAIAEIARGGRVSWVFGTERTGLSIAEAQQCQALCSIESHPEYGSLNLAQAVQVIAYAARAALHQPVAKTAALTDLAPSEPEGHRGFATLGQVEGVMVHLEKTLTSIEFLNPAQPKRLMPRLRRLFARTRLEQEEVDILRGICATVDKLVQKKSL